MILTSNRKGTAAYCLPVLLQKTNAEIVQVIYNRGVKKSRSRFYRQKLKKIFKIGLFGAVNGIRIRKWFSFSTVNGQEMEDIAVVCKKNNIPFAESSGINTAETIDLLKACNADLGLSMGNSYIASKVFSIPRYGMLNIHGEILPQFQNAQSVIWQLYEGSAYTGYTIHKVDKKIDTGEIFKQEKFPIRFKPTLGETVNVSCAEILFRAANGLAEVINNYEEYDRNKVVQGKGASYTTPSFRQFLRIYANFKKLNKQACAESQAQ